MVDQNDSEKSRYERKRMDRIYWAGLMIWAGLVFGAEKLGYLPRIGKADAWTWIFLGAGIYALLGSVHRLSSNKYKNPTRFDYIWGGILLIIGLNGLTPIKIAWPLILILVGVVLFIGSLKHKE